MSTERSTSGGYPSHSPSPAESAGRVRSGPERVGLLDELLWTVVDDTVTRSGGDAELQVQLFRAHLESSRTSELALLDHQMTRASAALYSWDLWGAAYLLLGGSSATAFGDFRSWVISRGSATYARVRADPDALADVPFDDEDMGIAEYFARLPALVHEARTGCQLPDALPTARLGEPTGEPLDLREEALRARYPALAARVMAD